MNSNQDLDQVEIDFEFEGDDASLAGEFAENLYRELEAEVGCAVDRRRADPASMDFGTIVIALIGSKAIVILANAVWSWAKRERPQARGIRLRVRGVELDADTIDSNHVVSIVKQALRD